MEFLITGEPLEQVSECEKTALPGEVYVSRAVVVLLENDIKFGKKRKKDKVNSQSLFFVLINP